MTKVALAAEALARAGLAAERDAPLSRRTFWRIGGPADLLVSVHTRQELARVQAIASDVGLPVFVLGNGSNLLIADRGVRGIVVALDGDLADLREADDGTIVVGAGMRLTALLARARRRGWTGLEWAAGIPGTVGGAVRMNAGSALGECKDTLVDATVSLCGGGEAVLSREALQMSYRSTCLPLGGIVAEARFRPTGGDAGASEARVNDFLARRKASQPLDLPSCGSTFRNPPGDVAGRLIEAAGLKGLQVGGAQVSPKHANFVVNVGGATASDVLALIHQVEDAVFSASGVRLEREVVLAGDWGDAAVVR